jgi:hypothetical protein
MTENEDFQAPTTTITAVAAERVSNLPLDGAPVRPAPALDMPRRPRADDRPEILRRLNFSNNPDVLLATILDECHFLMREVATESALRAQTVQDRLAFVHTALACARTGAKVGDTIAAMQGVELSDDRKDAIALDMDKVANRLADEKSESDKQ